jgi:glycosyltransferase involved in cell wall biosynthesis
LWGNYPALRRYVRLIRVKLVDILRGLAGRPPQPQVTEKYAEWITPALGAALRVHAASPIDHVLATGNPYSSFEAARLISTRTGAPFSIDFRDPWTFDLYSGRPKTLDAASLAAELQIVESASACFHVNAAIAGAYSKRYPTTAAKHHVVPNGFDLSSIGQVHDLHADGALTLGMIGTITDRWPLEPVLAAWSLTRSHLPPGSRLLLAGHLGYFDNRSAQLRDTISEHRPGFDYVGPVSKAKVAKFYEQLDVVVVPVPEGEMVTSGKIYEALGLGIPLVCIQPAGGGARALLDQHPAAFGAEPRTSEIGDALLTAAKLAATMTAGDVGKIRRSMMVFERSTSIKPMVDIVAASLMSSAD